MAGEQPCRQATRLHRWATQVQARHDRNPSGTGRGRWPLGTKKRATHARRLVPMPREPHTLRSNLYHNTESASMTDHVVDSRFGRQSSARSSHSLHSHGTMQYQTTMSLPLWLRYASKASAQSTARSLAGLLRAVRRVPHRLLSRPIRW